MKNLILLISMLLLCFSATIETKAMQPSSNLKMIPASCRDVLQMQAFSSMESQNEFVFIQEKRAQIIKHFCKTKLGNTIDVESLKINQQLENYLHKFKNQKLFEFDKDYRKCQLSKTNRMLIKEKVEYLDKTTNNFVVISSGHHQQYLKPNRRCLYAINNKQHRINLTPNRYKTFFLNHCFCMSNR